MKKLNFLKYIFIIFVVVLIGYSVFYMQKQDDKETVDENIVQAEEQTNLTTIRTLRVAATNVDSINPIISRNQNVQDFSKLIYEPMLEVSEDYRIQNCLAKEWISLSDTAYVVVLKDGVKFHNGSELTATDVKFTIEQIQAIGEGSIYYQNVKDITKVEILSGYTVKITLDHKIPFFEYNLTFPIMSANYYVEDAILTSVKNNNAPGTGMYTIGNITGTEIELRKNENWWGIAEGKKLSLDTVLIKLYTSMGEAYNAFKMGNLDLLTTQSLNYEEHIGTIGYKTAEYVGRQHDYLAMNCSDGILKNKELRKAINYAIDKSNIIATVYGNKFYVADLPINESNYLYNIDKVSSNYNTNKSKEILEQSGWELKGGNWQKINDGTRARINLVVNENNPSRVAVAQEIEKQLGDFGIIVNLIKANDDQYQRYLENKNYDMILTGKYTGLSPDLTSYLGEGNLSDFKDAEVTEILRQIADLTDNSEELGMKYRRVLKLVEEEKPYISLYFSRNTVIYTQDLQGDISPNYYNIFNNIEDWVRQY